MTGNIRASFFDRVVDAKSFFDQDRQPLIAVEELIRESQNQPELRKHVERRLAELEALREEWASQAEARDEVERLMRL